MPSSRNTLLKWRASGMVMMPWRTRTFNLPSVSPTCPGYSFGPTLSSILVPTMLSRSSMAWSGPVRSKSSMWRLR
eukprot:8610611-Alexandrium_andersonii.AAC.1